jgi:putative PIN family toxin of toxin-antitoxin system
LDAFIDSKYSIAVSEDILKEYEEILQRHAAKGADKLIMEIFIESPDVYVQTVYYKWNALDNDPEDNKFFDIAVAANADYLITDDVHFNKVSKLKFTKINVLSSKEFLKIIKDNNKTRISRSV